MNLFRFLKSACLCVVYSATGLALEVSPEIVSLGAPPGGKATGVVNLINDSTERVEVQVFLRDVDSGENPSWLNVSRDRVRLRPGQTRAVRIKARVPRDAKGELVARVLAQGKVESSPVYYRVVRSIVVKVSGTEKCGLVLSWLKAEVRGGEMVATLECRNVGNVTLLPAFGVNAVLFGGRRATGYRRGPAVPVGPGRSVIAQITVPLSGESWTGLATATVQYRDADGVLHRVEKMVGD